MTAPDNYPDQAKDIAPGAFFFAALPNFEGVLFMKSDLGTNPPGVVVATRMSNGAVTFIPGYTPAVARAYKLVPVKAEDA